MAIANMRTGGFVGIERKFLDTELTTTALTAAWVPLNPTGTGATDTLSIPVVGTGESERIGRKYQIHSLYVQGQFQVPALEAAAAPPGDVRCRVIVYWDKQTNGAEAAATDIMDAGGAIDSLAFRNLQFTSRFKVLYDKTIVIRFPNSVNNGAANVFSHGLRLYDWNFYKKFKVPITVLCDGTTANVTSCTDNNLGLAALCSDVTLGPTIAYSARVRFTG